MTRVDTPSQPVAVVTGGGNGIGRATCVVLADRGYAVVAADRDGAAAAVTAAEIAQRGGHGVGVQADVTSSDDLARLRDLIAADFGRLDAAVNGAGLTPPSAWLTDIEEADFVRVLDVNVTGVWRCMSFEVPLMLASGGGSIVNISSRTGLSGSARRTSYSASKHAVLGLTRSAALELATQGIRVNSVCPGPIDTAMIDAGVAPSPDRAERLAASTAMNRIGRPEEVAEAIAWLCTPASSFVTGVELPVDGGVARGFSGAVPAGSTP